MFWADRISESAEKRFKDRTKGGLPIIIRDEKTLSGRVHVGSLRGVAIHGLIDEILTERKIANAFLYELNDFDPMDGLPVYLPKEKYLPFMGMPLYKIPSPDGKAKNYAEYFGEEFTRVITKIGFEPEYYRTSDAYKAGKFNEVIGIALRNSEKIREILKRVSGSDKPSEWYPVNVICPECGKLSTTKVTNWDGTLVTYTCGDYVDWAKGCGASGKISPFNGNAKLTWKVDWAAKFSVFDVSVEGGGKDHSTKGGSRDVANVISREVFKREPPLDIPYEFFNAGGKKMSSSKGTGLSAQDIGELIPPKILRLLLIQKDPKRGIEFVVDGDTIPVLYDTYDKLAENYFHGDNTDQKRLFSLVHNKEKRANISENILPRFSQIAYFSQMPHIDIFKEFESQKGAPLTKEDREGIEERIHFASLWIEKYAPEDFKIELQLEIAPQETKDFSREQKEALAEVLEYIKSQKKLDGQELHTKLHEIRKSSGLVANDFFGALYTTFLGKPSGPKAGWFFSVLDKNFLEKRLEEVSQNT